jgi:hypothetical protein
VLDRLVITALRILQEDDQQERDDVVAVLMMSCQVSRLNRPIDGAQTTIRSTQPAKNGARLAKLEAAPANRSKKPTGLVTELGMVPSSWVELFLVITET